MMFKMFNSGYGMGSRAGAWPGLDHCPWVLYVGDLGEGKTPMQMDRGWVLMMDAVYQLVQKYSGLSLLVWP